MREWYRLSFTPDHAVNKMKHFDNVTDLCIDGMPIKKYNNKIKEEAYDELIKALINESEHVPCNNEKLLCISKDKLNSIVEKLKKQQSNR